MNNKVLILGGGGRESAIAYKLNKEGIKVFAYPGNPGILKFANSTNIKNNDFNQIRFFITENKIDIVVIGPEQYLNDGLVDYLESYNIKVFGPSKNAAKIETDKYFAKKIMKAYGIPTAEYKVAFSRNECLNLSANFSYPYIIKFSGLAAGKGAFIIHSEEERNEVIKKIYDDNIFNTSSPIVIIEEFMEGEEASLFFFSDGKHVIPLLPAQDYKKAYDNDKGPNTGGMGSYAPCKLIDKKKEEYIIEHIALPILSALRGENSLFKGLLYAGLMINEDAVKIVEFNARFGDPETQSILPLMRSSLFDVFMHTAEGNINGMDLDFKNDYTTTVVIAAKGYPENYKKGHNISIDYSKIDGNTKIFHAGTKYNNTDLVSNGGRILNITSIDNTLENSIKRVYNNIKYIDIENSFYRSDIGLKGLKYDN